MTKATFSASSSMLTCRSFVELDAQGFAEMPNSTTCRCVDHEAAINEVAVVAMAEAFSGAVIRLDYEMAAIGCVRKLEADRPIAAHTCDPAD